MVENARTKHTISKRVNNSCQHATYHVSASESTSFWRRITGKCGALEARTTPPQCLHSVWTAYRNNLHSCSKQGRGLTLSLACCSNLVTTYLTALANE